VWRGQVLNDEAVLQPALTVTAENGFSVSMWGNADLTDVHADPAEGVDTKNRLTELDVAAAYALPLGEDSPVSVELGVWQYTFPEIGAASTREAYVTLGGNAPLAPTLSVYYDFDAADGFYGTFGLSQDVTLTEKLTLGLAASAGYADKDYNAYYFGVADDALNDGNVSATLTLAVTEKISLAALAQYTRLLDGDIRDGAKELYGKDDSGFGGLTLTYAF